MDSVTQATLGAAVGEAVLGRRLGNRAIWWGAAFGTLPDLDVVFAPLQDSVQFLVYHRGLSHSLLGVGVASLVLGEVFRRWYREHQPLIGYGRWFSFFVLVLLTHILLDCCTSYGTQIFAPFSDQRVSWQNIFIIDPLYTVPFFICVVACLFLRCEGRLRRTVNYAGLLLSTSYLAFTFLSKQHVEQVFAEEISRQQIAAERFMTCPTPLNSVLWYGIAEAEQGYYLGFYSLFDSTRQIEFQFVPRRQELLGAMANEYAIDRLVWFADGYYCVQRDKRGLIVQIMNFGKFGLDDDRQQYPFAYRVHRDSEGQLAIEMDDLPTEEGLGQQALQLWGRLKGN